MVGRLIIRTIHTLSVLKRRQIVGHVPHSISRPCSVFLQSHGMITCIVTGNRCFPIIAFFSGDTFKYGLRFPASFPVVSIISDTSKFASRIEEDGTSLQSGPFSSGKTTEVEDFSHFFKYFNSVISIQTITRKS